MSNNGPPPPAWGSYVPFSKESPPVVPPVSGGIAASSGGIAASSGGIAASSGGIAASSGGIAASSGGLESINKNDPRVLAEYERQPKYRNLINQIVPNLNFFIILPSGTEVSIDDICDHPELTTIYRTFQNRLVIILRARINSEIYWTQAFYCSSGESSGMANTWLPFNGIVIDSAAVEPGKVSTLFFKDAFGKANTMLENTTNAISYNKHKESKYSTFTSLNTRLRNVISNVYGQIYLTEGDHLLGGKLSSQQGMFRFGTLSFLLASYQLGGDAFKRPLPEFHSRIENMEVLLTKYFEDNGGIHPLKDCFRDPSIFPIRKPNIINAYIENNRATSYYNAFPELNYSIFVPNMVKINEVDYKLPRVEGVRQICSLIDKLFNKFKQGKITEAEVQAALSGFRNPIPEDVSLSDTVLDEDIDYLGGRRYIKKRKTKSRKNKKIRKGKTRKH